MVVAKAFGRIASLPVYGALAGLLAVASVPASAAEIVAQLNPTGGTNQADLLLDTANPNSPFAATSFVQAGSSINATYDTVSRILSIDDATLIGSDVTFNVNGFFLQTVRAYDVRITQDTAYPIQPQVGIDVDGSFLAPALIRVDFGAFVQVNNGDLVFLTENLDLQVEGRLEVDGPTGALSLVDLAGSFDDLSFGQDSFNFTLSGSFTLNFAGGLFADSFESGTLGAWTDVVP